MSDTGESDRPNDGVRDRVPSNRLKTWLLLEGNRWVITGVLLAGMFVLLVALGALDPAPLRQDDPIETVFQALVAGIITGVTLVVTITQLVLSQELGAVGDQRERMSGAMEFRRDVESIVDDTVAPPEPAAFLRVIVAAVESRAADLEGAVADSADEPFRESVETYVATLRENARSVTAELDRAQFGTFGVVYAALDFNYSWKIYEARELCHEHEHAVTDRTRAAFDDLVEALEYFGPAREHFKTLYFQWELINLSRAVMYAAVPAIAVSIVMILYLDTPGSLTGTILYVDTLVWVTSGAVTIALGPFMLLLSHILRIATVAKRTLAIGPFILRDTAESEAPDTDG